MSCPSRNTPVTWRYRRGSTRCTSRSTGWFIAKRGARNMTPRVALAGDDSANGNHDGSEIEDRRPARIGRRQGDPEGPEHGDRAGRSARADGPERFGQEHLGLRAVGPSEL